VVSRLGAGCRLPFGSGRVAAWDRPPGRGSAGEGGRFISRLAQLPVFVRFMPIPPEPAAGRGSAEGGRFPRRLGASCRFSFGSCRVRLKPAAGAGSADEGDR
jgi:hypothetical protein